MADEDEVDVLGDFSIDNLLSKNNVSCYDNSTEMLSCDYSLNTQWLFDNPSSNAECWYTNSDSDFNSVDVGSETNASLGFDDVICAENKVVDETGWTNDEKTSLLKGLEIFGKNSLHLSQFVGTKTPSQIKYYLKHHYKSVAFSNIYNSVDVNSPHQVTQDLPTVFKMSDLIEDAQIPASIEEVIAAVSTAKPTVQSTAKKKHCSNCKQMKIRRQMSPNKNKVIKKRKKAEKNIVIKEFTEIQEHFPPVVLPVSSGEELIKITKQNSETDSDEEIEVDIEENVTVVTETPVIEHKEKEVNECVLKERLKKLSDNIVTYLNNSDLPTDECILQNDVITEVEKCWHAEFFEGRPTKTPNRYLKIRKHIIDYWLENKPNYCTKTAVRQGLKNCGDVNCIGRVHQYLEQIGAINFGCEQTNYVRPLINLMIAAPPKEKPVIIPVQKTETVRSRVKKKYFNDGEGGYTMVHDENGEIIDTTVVNKETKPRSRPQNIKLVYCKTFSDDNPAPFSVTLHLSALLLMDLHAHSALIEVMGLLGGTYDSINRVLHITRYVSCKGIDHSNTHCDMCPVSQSEASEQLISEGVEVIGWYHSHPTFYPNPSLQDIDTQLNMQLYLSNEYKPFVGVILSPFRALATALVSEYRCLIVNKEDNETDAGTPYKFQTNLTSDDFSVDLFLQCAADMFITKNNIPKEYVIDFTKPYFQDSTISFLEKLLCSVKLHLARCSELNKMTCDAIVQGITEICLNYR